MGLTRLEYNLEKDLSPPARCPKDPWVCYRMLLGEGKCTPSSEHTAWQAALGRSVQCTSCRSVHSSRLAQLPQEPDLPRAGSREFQAEEEQCKVPEAGLSAGIEKQEASVAGIQ